MQYFSIEEYFGEFPNTHGKSCDGKVVNFVPHYSRCLSLLCGVGHSYAQLPILILLVAKFHIFSSPGSVNFVGVQKSDSPNSLQAEAVKV